MILTEATQERATPLSGQPAAALGIIKNKKTKKKNPLSYTQEKLLFQTFI